MNPGGFFYGKTKKINAGMKNFYRQLSLNTSAMIKGKINTRFDYLDCKVKLERFLAHGLVITATGMTSTMGAIPIPIANSFIIGPIQLGMIKGLAKIYGIEQNEDAKQMITSIIEVSSISQAAKMAMIKAIPEINLAGSVINAIVAESITAALGESAIYILREYS